MMAKPCPFSLEHGMPIYPPEWKTMHTALCHDWLTGMRGGERVLEILADGFPDADIYTLLHNEGSVSDRITSHRIHTSWLQHIPKVMDTYRYYLPLMPKTIRLFHPPEGDLILSTSHCVAKGLPKTGRTKHLCYCFTPMRYAWLFRDDYFGRNPIKRAIYDPILSALQRWDKKTAAEVDHFVAISEHVRERIHRFYGRDASVVYPPADTDYFTPEGEGHDGYDFIVSAMVPYKKVDLAIQAYNRLGYPLKIMGGGGGLDALKRMAGPNITFLGRQPDEVLRESLRRCRFLVFPGEEDFGIVPVEAMACGKPVIAYGKGGVTETVVDGESGVFFAEQTEDALVTAVERAAEMSWDPAAIRTRAERFSIQAFIDGMNAAIAECLGQLQ
jgi:glycosyltransferase involved in cell wall biosynthesis